MGRATNGVSLSHSGAPPLQPQPKCICCEEPDYPRDPQVLQAGISPIRTPRMGTREVQTGAGEALRLRHLPTGEALSV